MKELNKEEKWMLKQFTIMNKIARIVYNKNYYGSPQNFYDCFVAYEDGVFGWIKEYNSFKTAIEIYDEMTNNDGLDIISNLGESIGDEELRKMTAEDISNWYKELQNYEI